MDKIFLVVMFSAVVFCQPTYGAMWRADEKNTVRVDLRECEDAAEDGLKIGSERIGNRNRFVFLNSDELYEDILRRKRITSLKQYQTSLFTNLRNSENRRGNHAVWPFEAYWLMESRVGRSI